MQKIGNKLLLLVFEIVIYSTVGFLCVGSADLPVEQQRRKACVFYNEDGHLMSNERSRRSGVKMIFNVKNVDAKCSMHLKLVIGKQCEFAVAFQLISNEVIKKKVPKQLKYIMYNIFLNAL